MLEVGPAAVAALTEQWEATPPASRPHYVQALAGHSSVSIGERYVQLATAAFPGAADKTKHQLFGAAVVESSVET